MAKRRKKLESTQQILDDAAELTTTQEAVDNAVDTSRIVIVNEGPIKRAELPIPPDGGLVVLTGRNGVGKTRALNAVRGLWDKDVRKDLSMSDGSEGGSVQGLGVTIRLGRNNTSRGELVCDHVIGDIDLTSLIDPGVKDPIAADTRRLNVLVRLAKIKLSLDDWSQAVGYAVDQCPVDLREAVCADPVESADRIRRKFHEVALTYEKRASEDTTEAQNIRQTVTNISLSEKEPVDEGLLMRALDAATQALAVCEHQIEQHDIAESRRMAMKEQLSNLVAASEDLSAIEATRTAAGAKVKQTEEIIAALERQLRQARVDLQLAQAEHKAATDRHVQVTEEKRQRDLLQAAIDEPLPACPTPGELDKLRHEKAFVAERLAQGKLINHAIEVRKRADALAARAQTSAKEAERMREVAYSTNTLLEAALVRSGFTDVRVHNGVICMETNRGLEPISELSEGQRTSWAFSMLAKGMPEGAIVTLDQEAFESLDPDNRRLIHRLALEKRITVFTALAADGDLTVRQFSTDENMLVGAVTPTTAEDDDAA